MQNKRDGCLSLTSLVFGGDSISILNRLFISKGVTMLYRILCSFLLCLVISVPSASAAFFNVDFNDDGGPHWTGTIDTTTDTLTILTWVENSGFPDLWTPMNLPLIWTATDNTGSIFDIPDDWSGNFSINWGFLSPDPLTDILFNEGTYSIEGQIPGWNIKVNADGLFTNTGSNRMSPWPRYSTYPWIVDAEYVSITAAPVPIPAAAILFGSSFFGIIGISRKFKK